LITIDRSDISGNVVEGYLGGGVAENGGGVPGTPNAVTITNSLISSNLVADPAADGTYARGGGIGEDGGAGVSVTNTTITGNTVQGATGEPANGGGIAETGGGGVSTLNATVTDNTADGSGGIGRGTHPADPADNNAARDHADIADRAGWHDRGYSRRCAVPGD